MTSADMYEINNGQNEHTAGFYYFDPLENLCLLIEEILTHTYTDRMGAKVGL